MLLFVKCLAIPAKAFGLSVSKVRSRLVYSETSAVYKRSPGYDSVVSAARKRLPMFLDNIPDWKQGHIFLKFVNQTKIEYDILSAVHRITLEVELVFGKD